MSNPLNDLAPYPRRESEVTAESLTRSLMVQAQANWHRTLNAGPAAENHPATNRLIDVFGIVKLLKALQAIAPDTADEVARDLWSDWRDGAAMGEWLHAWLVDAGIAPERVDAAAADVMRDAA
jgi:hypothetical protein